MPTRSTPHQATIRRAAMTANMEITPVGATPMVVADIPAEGTLAAAIPVGATIAVADTERQKMEFICTFGFGHIHPVTKESLGNNYIVVNAEDEVEAHEIMYGRFGQKWSFCYRSREEAGVDQFNLVELVDDHLSTMKEAGLLIDYRNEILYTHMPEGCTAGSIPDSTDLWTQIWAGRDVIKGFAHSHPGFGLPGPSHTDLTTFAAVEAGLGRRLTWWITSEDGLIALQWTGPDPTDYCIEAVPEDGAPAWVTKLREISWKESKS